MMILLTIPVVSPAQRGQQADVAIYLAKHAFGKRTEKKNKFFFSRRARYARCHSAGRTPTVFAKKRPDEHSIPPGPNFSENSRHEK
jgi:hypothetical protein